MGGHAKITNLFAFAGNNMTEKQEALESQVKKWLGDQSGEALSREIYFGEEIRSEVISQSYETVSMFSTKKAIILRHFEKVSPSVEKQLAQLLSRPNDNTGVFLETEKWSLKSPVQALFKKNGQLLHFKLPYSNKIPEWLVSRCLNKFKRPMHRDAALFLWECVGDNLQELEYELNKLNTFLPEGAPITAHTIHETVLPHRNINFFELQKNMGLRDKARSLLSLTNNLNQGEPPLLLAIRLFHHFFKLLKIRTFLDRGIPIKEIADIMHINHFIFTKEQFAKQAMSRTPGEWKKTLIKLSKLETEFKRGKYPQQFEAETAFAELI